MLRPSLSYRFVLRPLYCLFLSDRLRLVILHIHSYSCWLFQTHIALQPTSSGAKRRISAWTLVLNVMVFPSVTTNRMKAIARVSV